MSIQSKRVLVAMSGGVDSSVAAVLLKNQGYQVIGVHLQLWNEGETTLKKIGGRCCSLVDSQDARTVCDQIDIPYYVINAEDLFQDQVIDYFVHEYLQNRTPNPCAQCNQKIKFNYLFQKADELDCNWVATGHYAQVFSDLSSDRVRLNKALDAQKDQTYFLFGLTQKALKRTLMPIGGLAKPMVRKIAADYGFSVADKADSQEICFVGEGKYSEFIEQRVSSQLRPMGLIRTVNGEIVGEHAGLHRYTIGQRKGLQLRVKNPENYYVVGFDAKGKTLIVGDEKDLFRTEVRVSQVNWIRSMDKIVTLRCRAKIRSTHQEAPCEVIHFENEIAHVVFKDPQRALTPGQAMVFYDEEECLGGGLIEQIL